MVPARQGVIDADPGLQERELLKLAGARHGDDRRACAGAASPDGGAAAESGVAVFRVGFARWIAEGEDMAAIVDTVVADLRGLTAAAR